MTEKLTSSESVGTNGGSQSNESASNEPTTTVGRWKNRLDRAGQAVNAWWERNRFRLYIGGLVVLLLLAYLWPRMLVSVEAGERGVMYRRLGNGVVLDRVWGEGLHVIPPWDELTVYEIRVQERSVDFPTLTREGLRIDLEVSVRYRPDFSGLGELHEFVGPDYYSRVILPEIQSALRRTVGDRTAFEIYSTEGDVLQQAIRQAAYEIEKKPIRIDQLLIKEIHLPPIVKEAIDYKHKQEQYLLEYEFRLQRAEKEAERKRTEATGIRDYDAIIMKQGISEPVLRWRGIEATLELAKSSNAKVIVIGAGRDNLPIILDASKDEASVGDNTPAQSSRDSDSDAMINESALPGE